MQRFWSKVNKTSNCWEWTGAIRAGYGCLKIDKKVVDAHRVSWQLSFGEIPKDKLICHTCDNRKCVNPKHLFLGSYSENMKDASQKGRLKWPRNFKTGHIPKNRKLTLQQVKEIRENNTLNKRQLAKKFGIDEKAIRLLLKFETYK